MDSENIKNFITQTLGDEVDGCDVFFFDSKNIQSIAFRDGIKCDCVESVKKKIKDWGFNYNYTFGAYVRKKENISYSEYRNQKNEMLDKLIKWKMLKYKTSENGKKEFGRFVYHQV